MIDKCPRCGHTEFDEVDCGPDSYEDDITYTSYRCQSCKLFYDGWAEDWYEVEGWWEVEDAKPWKPEDVKIQRSGVDELIS